KEEPPIKKPKEKEEPPIKKPKEKEEPPIKKIKVSDKKAPMLKDIENIGKGDIKELKDLGITTLQELVKEDAVEIASITGMDQYLVQQWIEQAKELLGLPLEQKKEKIKEKSPTKEKIEDPLSELLKIKGVGKIKAEKLIEAGIMSYSDLINYDPKELSKKSKISEKSIIKIIESAKELDE
ncbi:MAG: helix-hairpin-helix domain-containing protein, partial [Promethearchaeota archaeon]